MVHRQYLDQSAETGLPVFTDDNHIHHVERWQNEAMDAVHTKDWKPKSKKDMEEFSKQVDKLIQAENEALFCQDVFEMLHFSALDDRLQSIAPAQEGTLEWIYENGPSAELWGDNPQQSSLTDWLGSTSGHNLFWITGKPGSGKSTLMKTLLRNPKLFPDLEAWSGASPGITAAYFLWSCSGTELQMSYTGLLRSLIWESLQDMIYGPLQKDPSIVQWLFADRWQQFSSYGGGHHPFDSGELRRAFDLMVSDISKKFLLLIDGLDELDGYPEAVVELLTSTAKRANVKIIISSRPLPGFQHAFEGRPVLSMEPMIKDDIQAVVLSLFNQDDGLTEIRTKKGDTSLETTIIRDITKRSAGSFLWATMATQFLLRSLNDADDMTSLKHRVQALPAELEALLPHMFKLLPEKDCQQASRLFRLVSAHGYPTLLGLSFANDLDTKSSISAPTRPLQSTELNTRITEICSLLEYPAQNFLTMFETIPQASQASSGDVADKCSDGDGELNPLRLKVNFAHRTIKDFIESGSAREQIRQSTGYESFSADEHWANASLWTLKTLEPNPWASEQDKLELWDQMASCIEYALRLEESDKKVRVTYLDEVGRAGVAERLRYIWASATDLPKAPPLESFMDIAVWLNLSGYVGIKAKNAERKEIRHALGYFQAMRKRLGTGGEEKWLGDRKRMRAVYDATSPELLALLEYYGKALRFGTAKPHVDIPEGI